MNRRGKMKTELEMLECNRCKKKFRGAQGVKTHERWAHSRSGRRKMMMAATRGGLARVGQKHFTFKTQRIPGSGPVVKVSQDVPQKLRDETSERVEVSGLDSPARAQETHKVNFCYNCGCQVRP